MISSVLYNRAIELFYRFKSTTTMKFLSPICNRTKEEPFYRFRNPTTRIFCL